MRNVWHNLEPGNLFGTNWSKTWWTGGSRLGVVGLRQTVAKVGSKLTSWSMQQGIGKRKEVEKDSREMTATEWSGERGTGCWKKRDTENESGVKMCAGSNDQLMSNSAFVWHNAVTTATVHSTIITHTHTCRRDPSTHWRPWGPQQPRRKCLLDVS